MSETQRLEALRQLGISMRGSDASLDHVCRLLKHLLSCSAAGVALVDERRVWFAATAGELPAELPREHSYCGDVIAADAPLIVGDVHAEPSLANHPARLAGPEQRFFAGVPLRTPGGTAVGVLCAVDGQPHVVGEERLAAFGELAALVERLLSSADLQALRRSLDARQQWYRALVEPSSDVVYTLDPAGGFLSCSGAIARMTGYDVDDLLGRPLLPLIAAEDRERAASHFWRCLDGEPQQIQARILRKDGGGLDAAITASPYIVDGDLRGVVGTMRDITAQLEAERRLKASEERLALALETSRQGVWEWDVRMQMTYQSPQLRMILGHPAEELWEHVEDWRSRLHPEDRAALAAETRTLFQGRDSYEGECRIACRSGEYRWFHFYGRVAERDDDGAPTRVVGATADVHERRRAERERQREGERTALAVRAAGVGIFELQLDGQILYWDARMCALYGLAHRDELPHIREVVASYHPDDRRRVLAIQDKIRQGAQHSLDIEFRVLRPDGSIHYLRVLGMVTRSAPDQPQVLIGTCWEVTEARELERQLSFQAVHDALTGLYNRTEFERRLGEALAAASVGGGQPCAVCFIDLDRFKIVNDTAGHAAGDALLAEVGHVLARGVRGSDVLARLGGDEFGLLLVDCGIEQAEQVAAKLIERIEALRFRWEGRVYEISASVGVAAGGLKTVAEAMSQADVACYAAKSAGRGRVLTYRLQQSEAQQHHRELLMAASIREALAARRFCLYAQEIVAVSPNVDASPHYELLVRMHDVDGSILPPGAFIPAAERYDLMAQIDRWVLSEALDRQAARISATPGLAIAINLSAHSLNDPGFLPFVRELVGGSPLAAARVQFEITETAMMTHLARASQVVEALRGLGCKVALDDFGSGLSSFNYLKHFPVDYVKIDGSFIKNLHDSVADRKIVDSIHDLAHKFGARTIAEYVENDEILARLREIGVDYAQGYGIANPCPLEDILRLESRFA